MNNLEIKILYLPDTILVLQGEILNVVIFFRCP